MKTSRFRISFVAAVVVIIALSVTWESTAQNTVPSLQEADQETSASSPGMDPARAKIWNSPQMVHGREWLAEYCKRSARISPQQAKEYLSELEALTPVQMKLWLLKFEHEDEERQRQYQAWQKVHEASLRHALAVHAATRQAYANINREETEAAQVAEGKLDQQTQRSSELQEDKMQELDSPHPEGLGVAEAYMGYYGYPGGWGGLGGNHYHIHVHPLPAAR